MPPRGRPPTRSQSRAKSVAAATQVEANAMPESHVQTLPDEVQEVPGPSQLSQPVLTSLTNVIPAQLQAVSQLLDVLERRSQGLISVGDGRYLPNRRNPAGASQPSSPIFSPNCDISKAPPSCLL